MRSFWNVSTLLISLFLFNACAKDEVETTGGISGLLSRVENGEPLSAANISLNPGGKSATTGSDGRYEFANLEPGQYTVQARCDGFKTNTKQITVIAGEIASGDMQLAAGVEDFTLSVSELRFRPGKTQNTFDILNTSVLKSITWQIPATYPSWLTVSEHQGTIPKEGQRGIVVSLKNNPSTESEGYITVEVAGSTKQIHVLFNVEDSKTGGVSGYIRSLENGTALSGASISLSPGGQSVTTGSDGLYEFLNLEPGKYTVSAIVKGYQSESKGITIVAGTMVSADLQLSPEAVDFTLSESQLDFTSGSSLKSFDIVNSSSNRSVDWKILSGYPDWVTLSETSGTLSPGGQRAINVTLKNALATNKEGYITVEAVGSTKQVYVTFTANGGNPDDGGGDNGGGTEDYSSVTISQCDSRLKAQVVSCQRTGTTVVFTCNLTNSGLGNVNDFRIYPPSSKSLINDGVRSLINDDRGNEYPYATISYRGGSASATNTAGGAMPEGGTYKCTVTLSGVPEGVKKLTLVKLGVYAYPDSQFHLANKYIDFKNVPIY